MRGETNKAKLDAFMSALGNRAIGAGSLYLTGGATAVLYGWRDMTIDVDIKPDPEPPGLFEALAQLKNELDVNVKLAAPDQFIPPYLAGVSAVSLLPNMAMSIFSTTTPTGRCSQSFNAGMTATCATCVHFYSRG